MLGLELAQMLLFAGLVAAGVLMRHRADFHKRLMLLATATMLPNPISRLPISFDSNLAILLIFDGILVSAIVIDSVRRRSLHRAFLWGGMMVILTLHGAFAFAYSARWHLVATKLVS